MKGYLYENEIDLGNYLRIFLMQSKIFLGVVATIVILWIAYFMTATRVYNVESLLQVESSNYPNSESLSSAFIMGDAGDSTTLENQIVLYDTRSNMLELISSLNLQVSLKKKNDFDSIKFESFEYEMQSEDFKNFLILLNTDGTFNISSNGESLVENAELGIEHNFDGLKVKVLEARLDENEEYELTFYSKNYMAEFLQDSLIVSSLRTSRSLISSGGLIRVSMDSDDPELAIKIINKANDIFINDGVRVKSQKASKAISFIDERLLTLEQSLDRSKEELNSFQRENKSVNVDLETETILQSLTEAQKQLTELELEEATIQGTYTSTNPQFLNLQAQKNLLNNQISEIERRISVLPQSQQQYIDLYRDVEISQQLYTELQNKKLNYAIVEASTLGNVRVVDQAYTNELVSPLLSSSIAIFLLALIAGVIVALIRGLFFTPLSNPAEISDMGVEIPLVGVLPKGLADPDDNDIERMSQSLESLILNINNLKEEKRSETCVVLITSPTASNGKTFVSNQLSKKLSSLNHKTLLIDADFKRGDQHKNFDKDTITQSEFKFNKIDGSEMFDNFKIDENLFFIPRIKN